MSQSNEWAKGVIKLHSQIQSMVETLMGDLQEQWPTDVDELLIKKGNPKEAVAKMSAVEKLEKIIKLAKSRPSSTEALTTALDLIFEMRYGWPPGTADKMTFPEVFVALEHAMEHDDPSKPSVWELTK